MGDGIMAGARMKGKDCVEKQEAIKMQEGSGLFFCDNCLVKSNQGPRRTKSVPSEGSNPREPITYTRLSL